MQSKWLILDSSFYLAEVVGNFPPVVPKCSNAWAGPQNGTSTYVFEQFSSFSYEHIPPSPRKIHILILPTDIVLFIANYLNT